MKSKMLFSIALFAAAGLVSSVQGAIFDNYNGGTTIGNPGGGVAGTEDLITDSSPLRGFAYQFTAGESASLVDITAAIRAVSGSSTTVDVAIWNDNAGDVGSRLAISSGVTLSTGADLTINNLSVSITSGNDYWISFSNASDSNGATWSYSNVAAAAANETADSGNVNNPNSDGSDWALFNGAAGVGAVAISAVPEPSSIALVSGLCLVGFAAVRRVRSKK